MIKFISTFPVQKRLKQGFNRISWSLRFISLISILLLIILLAISWIYQWDPFIWNVTQYLGPLLFLGIWIPFTLSFLTLSQEISSLKKTFAIIVFGSILVVLGAVLLNQRLLLLIFEAFGGLFIIEEGKITEFIVFELTIGIFLPINEEILKVIPIIVVAHASIVIFDPAKSDFSSEYKTRSSISTIRQFGFYGIVSGTIFTFLELFMYQWGLTSIPDSTEAVFLQILFRTLFPIHILTTFLICLGIGTFKIRLAENSSIKKAILASSGYFALGCSFHSFWNSINVFYSVYYPDRENELYLVLAIFGIISILILFFGILRIFTQKPNICSYCGLEERGSHFHEQETPKSSFTHQSIRVPLGRITHISLQKLRKRVSCPFCLNPLILGACSTCGARIFINCPNCNSFLSETSSSCPHCKKKIKPLIELENKSLVMQETIILGISALASVSFLLAPLTILIFSQLGDFAAEINPILLFYFFMSLTALINVMITLFLDRTSGILVLFCFFLQLILVVLVILLGFTTIGLLRAIMTLDIISLIIFSFSGLITTFICYRFWYVFLYNYSPIFPEYRLNFIQKSDYCSTMELENNAS